jgi:hypothetical protein
MRTALVCLLLALSVGCVRSMHPIYTPETLTYDPALVGVFVDDGEDKTRIEIAPAAGNDQPGAVKSYRVVHTDKDGKSATLSGHLARVGDLLVADLTVADEKGIPASDFYRAHLFPLHTFWVVKMDEKSLTLRTVSHDWMQKFVAEQPGAVAHYKSNDDVILTAPPDELQKFLVAHAKEMLTDEDVLRREPADAGAAKHDVKPPP